MIAVNNFEILFQPIEIGPLTIKNRIVMPAMGTLYATWNGEVTDRMIDYYRERARGGVGMIVVEYAYVHRSGQVYFHQSAADRDSAIGGLQRLALAIRREGAAAALQLVHVGRLSYPEVTGFAPLAPSPVLSAGGVLPKAMSIAEIRLVQKSFADAAVRAKQAGFDAVELHMAHGYLIHSFLTPLANNRDDEYGGSLANRARFALETLAAVRAAVGDKYPVMCKISGSDYAEGGVTIEEVKTFAKWLEQGGVNAITVSGGLKHETDHMVTPPMSVPRGFRADLAGEVKEVVSIPVISVGRINHPSVAEEIISSGKADMVAVGRALIADPWWPAKVAGGDVDRICPCIACNQGCIGRIMSGLPISCLANPLVGREAMFRNRAPTRRSTVVVIGGGPGGMAAARAAALKGHRVKLVEKERKLGGRLLAASKPPFKEEFDFLREFLISEISSLGVEILYGQEATPELVKSLEPNAVIVACGARPVIPEGMVPGQNGVFLAEDVLFNPSLAGKKVVIVGGGMVGLETCELLTAEGCEVVVIEMGDQLAPDFNERAKKLLMDRLWHRPVDIMLKTCLKAFQERTVILDRLGIEEKLHEVDSLVIAMGYRAEPNELLEGLCTLNVPVKVIGDAVKPRSAMEAIREGFEAGYQVQ